MGLVGGGSILIKYRFGHRYTLFILVIQVEDGIVRATVQDMSYMYAIDTGQTQLREIDSENEMSCFRPEVLKIFKDLESGLKAES